MQCRTSSQASNLLLPCWHAKRVRTVVQQRHEEFKGKTDVKGEQWESVHTLVTVASPFAARRRLPPMQAASVLGGLLTALTERVRCAAPGSSSAESSAASPFPVASVSAPSLLTPGAKKIQVMIAFTFKGQVLRYYENRRRWQACRNRVRREFSTTSESTT